MYAHPSNVAWNIIHRLPVEQRERLARAMREETEGLKETRKNER